ncbi:MAG: hypothetical protein IID45_06005 [Planctomycetes bacterium]|nr:hypothetical protein [Planctomycetota bacterium]
MQQQWQHRLRRVPSYLGFSTRGPARRRKRPPSLTPALESLESRTLLSAGSLLKPTFAPVGGATMGGTDTNAEFQVSSDVRISWPLLSGSRDYEILIYDVDTGREVLRQAGLTATEFEPASLTGAALYQVFVRSTNVSNETSDWSGKVHYRVANGQHPTPTLWPVITGVQPFNDGPSLTWTRPSGIDVASYELVIYNINAGQEVFRQTDIAEEHFPVFEQVGFGDDFQLFVRAKDTSGELSQWSRVHISRGGGGTTQVIAAPQFHSPLIDWPDSAEATSYDVLVYDIAAGQEVINVAGLASSSYDPLAELNAPGNYQVFYRIRRADDSTGLWSSPLEFHLDAIA